MSQQDQVEFTLWLRENQKAFLRAAKMICFDTPQNPKTPILKYYICEIIQNSDNAKYIL